MKHYAIGLITGIFLTLSAVTFLGATKSAQNDGRYQFIGGSTVDMKVFDTRTWNKKPAPGCAGCCRTYQRSCTLHSF